MREQEALLKLALDSTVEDRGASGPSDQVQIRNHNVDYSSEKHERNMNSPRSPTSGASGEGGFNEHIT